MKLIKENAWSFWLGFSLSTFGFSIFNWRFWVIFVPVLFLVIWREDEECP